MSCKGISDLNRKGVVGGGVGWSGEFRAIGPVILTFSFGFIDFVRLCDPIFFTLKANSAPILKPSQKKKKNYLQEGGFNFFFLFFFTDNQFDFRYF